LLCTVLLSGAACSSEPETLGLRKRQRTASPDDSPSPPPRRAGEPTVAPNLPPGFLVASSFERPICGVWQHPSPQCEFGVQGDDTSTGDYPARTGDSSARVQRMSTDHMGILHDVPIPDGHAFVGVAVQVPDFPSGAFPEVQGHDPNIQLMQLTPTDGKLPAVPVEVRLFEDRQIGIGLWSDKRHTVVSDWTVPVDEWFYIVVEINNGDPAPQRMWIYDSNDELVDQIEASLQTRQEWAHGGRTAQKVGGSTSTDTPMYTYYDDWYIATENMGPIHISPTGEAITE
jgi:hypothetical protein